MQAPSPTLLRWLFGDDPRSVLEIAAVLEAEQPAPPAAPAVQRATFATGPGYGAEMCAWLGAPLGTLVDQCIYEAPRRRLYRQSDGRGVIRLDDQYGYYTTLAVYPTFAAASSVYHATRLAGRDPETGRAF